MTAQLTDNEHRCETTLILFYTYHTTSTTPSPPLLHHTPALTHTYKCRNELTCSEACNKAGTGPAAAAAAL